MSQFNFKSRDRVVYSPTPLISIEATLKKEINENQVLICCESRTQPGVMKEIIVEKKYLEGCKIELA